MDNKRESEDFISMVLNEPSFSNKEKDELNFLYLNSIGLYRPGASSFKPQPHKLKCKTCGCCDFFPPEYRMSKKGDENQRVFMRCINCHNLSFL